ncbi:N-(5'-phosphoribosyl)anthranilate isomerase [bacterium]|nr:N-(5'-phosphoribosyl)anthranilate isomerase [bacterium]
MPASRRESVAMWVKVCGIRDLVTAQRVCDLGADAIGLNFFAPSPRCVDRSVAHEIAQAIGNSVELVGLFVNHDLTDVLATVADCRFRTVQLHGNETPEYLAELTSQRPDLRLLRAFRIDESGCGAVAEYLVECERLNVRLGGCLIDAHVSGEYGGTGKTAPWDLLADQYDAARWPRLIVAGGLTPANVAEAIRVTRPFGVDVASGVESARGVKDLDLVRKFIVAARAASHVE